MVRFDEKGLIPVIVQDYYTNQVLTLAYLNQESLQQTLESGKMTYFSRKRQKLWVKGETSGNFQYLRSLTADCDEDALVARVVKDGPACHTGSESCFTNGLYGDVSELFSLEGLQGLLKERKKVPQADSYTSYLFDKGLEKILKKVGEESAEVIIGGIKEDKEETIYEIADLAYHVLVLMTEMDISVAEVKKELTGRHVIDHKLKQERMK
ncbi:bifunctional phosphoribosyl-AMP cyclohydrolase/phosphoribosyl-ATP diphosphatase HisIE [Enterococcus mediterraneensis]|uniref:bifunctional phosphoribosyl-AMP cyclohydrolase/phosphoribosyl-ATP diphosphatase HisIE n=1 Tax=Enterococcus mediterraneensis TaxID=2364791 RepID=UPI000F06EFD5|nr:bifunctional phosphoribosyl-AMP cyclohydrolase/phosphoribosyl-ATP diphosphatase HisIE [Enterococcus mediterraneensis]